MKVITKKEAVSLDLNRFFTGKPCKRGHLSERNMNGGCEACRIEDLPISKARSKQWVKDNKARKKSLDKDYRDKNKDDIAAKLKIYYGENIESIKAGQKIYRDNNKDKSKVRQDKWRGENVDKIRQYNIGRRDFMKVYAKKYYDDNIVRIKACAKKYNEDNPLFNSVRWPLKNIEFAVMDVTISKAESDLGYSKQQLMERLESQFQDGMSWDNRNHWQIDHIKPVSLFIKQGITDPAIINALSNLQPLWPFDNMSKGCKYNED